MYLSAGLTQPDNCSRRHQGCTQAILRLQGKTLQEHLQFHVIAGAQDEGRDFERHVSPVNVSHRQRDALILKERSSPWVYAVGVEGTEIIKQTVFL